MRHTIAVIAAILVGTIACVYVESFSSSFQSCVSQETSYYSGDPSKKNISRIKVVISTYSRCTGRFVNDHNGGITALASILIAAFTGTIWEINRSQLRHARQVERAFLCGGGGLKIHPNDSIFFGLDVQNYGKTPASLKAYAICICDRARLPSVPEYMTSGYKRETFFDEIPPSGSPTKLLRLYPVVNAHHGTKVVYGRFWYQDVWGDPHFFSFILSISDIEGRGFGTHPDVSEASPEYTKWT
jgi:hypothetical protein